MKKIFLLLLISLPFSQRLDQADLLYNDMKTIVESSSRAGQRVFWDYFGGETCTYCPAVDMALDQLMEDYPDDVVTIMWADPYWSPFGDADLCTYVDENGESSIGTCHDIREDYYPGMSTSRPHYRLQGNAWQGTGGGISSSDSASLYDNTFHPQTLSEMGGDIPYEISMNGYRDSLTIYYEVTLTMDAYRPADDMVVEIVIVEDKAPILYTGDGLVHGVRNLARHWMGNEEITIEEEGESETFTGEMVMMDHVLWTISEDEPWNPDSMQVVAIVTDISNGDIYQSMQQNVNEFDFDNDGVVNADDNCVFDSNPNQEDVDGDANGGDACDPCDNANIFVYGNVYGDYWNYGDNDDLSYNVDVFDVLRLAEIVESNTMEGCGYEAGDLTFEGDVNTFDIYALVGFIMDGSI